MAPGGDRRGSRRRAARRALKARASRRQRPKDKRSTRTTKMRRRATDASFEPLQGDSAPRRALASMPPTRFGPVALAPAPDEQGHDGCELRAPPDTSLQAGIGRRRKGPALDRITTTFGFALASTRTNMTFPIPGRRRLPPRQSCGSQQPYDEKRPQGRGKRRSRARSKSSAARRFPPPHERTSASRVPHRLRSERVWKTAGYATALRGRASPAVSHTRPTPLPKAAIPAQPRQRFRSFPQ